MKLRHLFMAVIASAFAFTACEEEIDLGFAKLTLDPLELTFGPEESSATFTMVATRDWEVPAVLPDWISLSATKGEADIKPQTITVTVLENKGNDREATIHLIANTEKADLVVRQKGALGEIQKGTGTKEDPYTVAGVLEFIETLGADKESDKVYVKGVITSVSTTFEASGTYGNATFYIADAAGAEQTFYVYQTYYLGNRKWKSGDTEVKEGDQVIIYGPVVNYKGNTPETAGKGASFIYSLNGKSEGGDGGGQGTVGEAKGSGTEADPFNVAAAINEVKNLTWTSTDNYEKVGPYFVKGTVKAVKEAFGAQYGNGTFVLVDEGYDAEFTAYRILYLGSRKWTEGDKTVKEGDEIMVYAELMNYRGNTPETVQGTGYLYSLNGEKAEGGGGQVTVGEPNGSGTETDPYNVAAAINAVQNLTWTSNEEYDKVGPYYVKGTVKSVREAFGAQYGNGTFVLVDRGFEAEFTAYRILYFGNKKWAEGDKTVKEGDEIVVYAELMNYRGKTPETVANSGYLYSLNGEKGEGGGEEPPVQEDVKAVTIAEFLAAAESQTQPYKLSGKMSNIKNTQYGNFDLVDATGSIVYVYGLTATNLGYGAKNDQSFASLNLKDGDDITIIGYRGSYNGTPEVLYAYFVEKTGGSGEEPPVQEEVKSVTIAEFLAAAESQTQPYKLSGKMSNIKNTQYGNFDLVDATGSIVYVYGLTATDLGYGAKNDKSFASLNLKEGDDITIIGYRGSYNGSPQVLYAYFVEKTGGSGEEPPVQEEVKAVTVAEFNAAAESQTQQYKLTGKISGDVNTTYGNFDLVDETGSVYVYGLTATDLGYGAKNDKSFASLNLAADDIITIIGYRGSYNGKIEVMYAYFVEKVGTDSSPKFGVENTQIRVAGSATSAVVKVTGNVAWTATTGISNLTLSPASGQGAGEITASFPANTTDGVVTYNFLVKTDASVATKEIEVMIVQDKASAGTGEQGEALWDVNQLKAAADKGAVNQMDEYISFKNASDYNGANPTELRIYKGKTLTVTAADGATIQQIEIQCTAAGTAKYGPGCFVANTGEWDYNEKQGHWNGSATEVVLTADTNQVRITELKVHYTK